MSDDINSLSADELFKLAEKRKVEEEVRAREAVKQQIADLRSQIRKLDAQHRKDRSALEAEISRLSSGGKDSGGRTAGISAKIVEIVKASGEISTKDINIKLKKAGFKAKNLSQSMAYLKKRGEVVSIGHGMYKAG